MPLLLDAVVAAGAIATDVKLLVLAAWLGAMFRRDKEDPLRLSSLSTCEHKTFYSVNYTSTGTVLYQ